MGWRRLLVCGLLSASGAAFAADQIQVTVNQVPAHGLVAVPVELGWVAQWCKADVVPEKLRVFSVPDGKLLPAQFMPDPGSLSSGLLLLQAPSTNAPLQVRLDFAGPSGPYAERATNILVRTRWYSVTHDARQQGGLPSLIEFAGTGKKFSSLRWNDRLYHKERGQFWLRQDRKAWVETVSPGPLCTVVRVAANYGPADGKPITSRPSATYDWFYFHDQPLVLVRAQARQAEALEWHEAHFLELGFADNAFPQWVGGEPRQEGMFAGQDKSYRLASWGALVDGRNAIGMLHCGAVLVYDGKGYGRYLHADGDAAWRGWSTTEFTRSAWLWLGADDQPAETIARLAAASPAAVRAEVGVDRLEQRFETLAVQLAKAKGAERSRIGWELAARRLLRQQGRIAEAMNWKAGEPLEGFTVLPAGDLRLVLLPDNGWKVINLADASTGALLLDHANLPLFELTLRHAGTGEEIRLTADAGWEEARLNYQAGSPSALLHWRRPLNRALGNLVITATLGLNADQHRLSWSISAGGQAAPWALWKIKFPQVAPAILGAESQLLLPQAAGVLKPVGREPLARFHGDYPSGWMSIQMAAIYDPSAGAGLYQSWHDPDGSTKQFLAEQEPGRRNVKLIWEIPVANMGVQGNRFTSPGMAVWQLLRGDWFDAAVIYRDWARKEAKWYPALTPKGRPDSPVWMRELSVWALSGGATNECVPQVLEFARALGVPTGFHWYNWHQIPFDNDYPHYFPAKPGFSEGVQQLQQGGVFVMPYINGRLWDTHDRGTNDFEFTRVARPAAAKDHQGEPYTETYGSKESNGDKVTLAVMCPVTPLWQNRQRDIVLRLFGEGGVKGVYMDQIAAAKPVLCFDTAHGHPLGGGAWWNEQGYWPMLEAIRKAKPADRMLTTECNAEPFLRWFDGYLTWHWQYDGQVPLFPAVYGGAIQMFGRAYRAGPTKDLALRMKAAQQLVYGEQLGWIHPGVVRETNNFPFFREAVRLRWNFRRYFDVGEMARPPQLIGDIPKVTADWQWHGVWPVTTSALMGGAWQIPAEKRLVLLFANVADSNITAQIHYDLAEAGMPGTKFTRLSWTAEGKGAVDETSSLINEPVSFPPRSVWAWELTPKP